MKEFKNTFFLLFVFFIFLFQPSFQGTPERPQAADEQKLLIGKGRNVKIFLLFLLKSLCKPQRLKFAKKELRLDAAGFILNAFEMHL